MEINNGYLELEEKEIPLISIHSPLCALACCIAGGTGRPLILGVFDNNCQVNKKKSLPWGEMDIVVKKENKKSKW
jgi:hypothetical protein